MSLTIINTPAAVADADASPIEYSTLVATESPVIFTFQKVDGNITDVSAMLSPNTDKTVITHDGASLAEAGATFYIYDALYGEMVAYTETEDFGSDAGYLYIDVPFEARFATDWLYVLSPQYSPASYVEIRLKINDVYETSTIRFTPSALGVAECDISRYLQAKITGEKIGNYVNRNDAETNQSGKFEVEYRERYAGDSNSWVEEGNDWYYLYAVRSKEQGSNLAEYWDLQIFNQFTKPVWWLGTPMDINFWWNPKYAQVDLTIDNYDSTGTLLSTNSYRLDTDGKGFLNSILISEDTIETTCAYIEVTLAEG